jgi:excisionase family DNA binding protein
MQDRLAHPIPEAAYKLGIGRSLLYELIAAGEINTVTIGRRRLVPESALVDYLDRRQHAAA